MIKIRMLVAQVIQDHASGINENLNEESKE
jgi:hypothetical protein